MTDRMPAPLRATMDHAHRGADLWRKSAQLAMAGQAPALAAEMTDLGRATLTRYAGMQRDWAAQWQAWAAYAAQIDAAPTLPKYAEHGMNTAVRAQQLVTGQMTATAELAENAAVSLGYLVNRRAAGDS